MIPEVFLNMLVPNVNGETGDAVWGCPLLYQTPSFRRCFSGSRLNDTPTHTKKSSCGFRSKAFHDAVDGRIPAPFRHLGMNAHKQWFFLVS